VRFDPIKRSETLQIELTLRHDQFEKYRQHVKDVMGDDFIVTVMPGDTFKITYTFMASYYGEIVRRFNALIHMLGDPELVVKATLQELHGLKCLIAEMILAIERRSELVRERSDNLPSAR
jgi:hypothetical protein